MGEAGKLQVLALGKSCDVDSAAGSTDSAKSKRAAHVGRRPARIVAIALPGVDTVFPITTRPNGTTMVDFGSGLEVAVEPTYPHGLAAQIHVAIESRVRRAQFEAASDAATHVHEQALIDPADLIQPSDDAAASRSPHVRLAAMLVNSYSEAMGCGRTRGRESSVERAAGHYAGMIEAATALLGEGHTSTELAGQVSAVFRIAEASRRTAADPTPTREQWRCEVINQLAFVLALAFSQA